MNLPWKRVVLKLSGEAFAGDGSQTIDHDVVSMFAEQLIDVRQLGVDLAVVVGGGNILRGRSAAKHGFERAMSDYSGMEATNINAAQLGRAIEQCGCYDVRVMSAHHSPQTNEPWILKRCESHLKKGRIVVLGGGIGVPFFTTDSAAVIRAAEIGADVVLKGTSVDGIYTSDPKKDPRAELLPQLTFKEAIDRELLVMDATAFTLCRENNLPIVVFDATQKDNLVRIVNGERIGTIVSDRIAEPVAAFS